MDDQIDKMTEQLVNVRLDLRELTTEVRSIKDLSQSVAVMDKRLIATESSSSSAHKRLDRIEANQTWMWRALGGAVLVAVATFVIKGGLVS